MENETNQEISMAQMTVAMCPPTMGTLINALCIANASLSMYDGFGEVTFPDHSQCWIRFGDENIILFIGDIENASDNQETRQ